MIEIEKSGKYFLSDQIQHNLEYFEDKFKRTLHSDIPLAEQVVQYIGGLKGKRIRPLLVFLSASLHGEIAEKTVQSSIVIELLHTATLVHDDVVDDSNTRRGSPTVNNLWSNKISVLVGDFLFSKTLTTLLDLRDQEALAIFSESAKLITEGELLQIERANDFNFEESNYFDLIYKKTACLFAASCELGVLSVIDDRRARNRMNTFGENLGMAFQIKDDLLDYVGDASKMGKPIGNDVRDRKITLPLIYALENASDDDRSSIIDLLNNGIDKDDQVDKVIRFVHQLNGVNQADLVARSYANKALQILKEYPPLDANNSLRKLVEFTIDREN